VELGWEIGLWRYTNTIGIRFRAGTEIDRGIPEKGGSGLKNEREGNTGHEKIEMG